MAMQSTENIQKNMQRKQWAGGGNKNTQKYNGKINPQLYNKYNLY